MELSKPSPAHNPSACWQLWRVQHSFTKAGGIFSYSCACTFFPSVYLANRLPQLKDTAQTFNVTSEWFFAWESKQNLTGSTSQGREGTISSPSFLVPITLIYYIFSYWDWSARSTNYKWSEVSLMTYNQLHNAKQERSVIEKTNQVLSN